MLDPANGLRRTRMVYLITKALISGVIIMAASEAAKRSPTYGALLVSLPLISILAMIWLWRDTGDNERIAALSEGTFWPLPMFLVLPAMLRNGFAFWTALAASCALTVALYLVAVWLLPRLGIST
jgi:glycopeptide antibiotics resistance protein